MTVYAIKKGDESNERLQSRFKKQFQETRLLKVLRDRRTHKGRLTKRLQRIRALKREQYRAENVKNQFYSNM
jgi:ribosomal protein S21